MLEPELACPQLDDGEAAEPWVVESRSMEVAAFDFDVDLADDVREPSAEFGQEARDVRDESVLDVALAGLRSRRAIMAPRVASGI
jgi:hypothetical protein